MSKQPNINIMEHCIQLAKNNLAKQQYALAALVVDANENIIYETNSKLITGYDPTAHPEVVAIRESAKIMKSRYLRGCFLYTTLEPCPMCTSAAIWAKMDGIVFGAYQQDAINYAKENPSDIFTWRQIEIPSKLIAQKANPKIDIYPGVLRDECIKLFDLCYI